jgi:Na+/phosphate symporter
MSKFEKKLEKHERLLEKLHDLFEEVEVSEADIENHSLTEYSSQYFDSMIEFCKNQGKPAHIVSEINLHRTKWSEGNFKVQDMVRMKKLERIIRPKKDIVSRLHYMISKEDYKK